MMLVLPVACQRVAQSLGCQFRLVCQFPLACLFILFSGLFSSIAVGESPNVVFIYIDDLGYSDVSFMQANRFDTPNIDRLANAGMIFSDAYANAPNCAPSRACLMSGQYSPRHGIYTVGNSDRGKSQHRRLIPIKNNKTLPPEVTTLGELFQSQEYSTCYIGKWHLGKPGKAGPHEQGFDFNFGGNTTGSPKGGYFSPYQNPQLTNPPNSDLPEYLTDRLTDEATKFIEDHQEKPFFLFLSHYAVHTPIQAKQSTIDELQETAAARNLNPKYAAMVHSVDESVGRLLDTIERLKLNENTLVIFYSDNGGYGKVTNCAPLRGSKGMPFEGGIRVPCAIQWTGKIPAGSTCQTPIIGVDFFATFCQMLQCDAPADQPLDGIDIMPLMTGTTDNESANQRALFWHFPAYLQGANYTGAHDNLFRARPFAIIRQGDWKLIHLFENNQWELYNLRQDIGESNNVAAQHTDLVEQLTQKLKSWQTDVQAAIPTELNPEFQPSSNNK